MKLYEINQEIERLLDELADAEEITEEQYQVLESLQNAKEDKVASLIAYIKNNDADANALKEESKKLAERARVAANKVSRAKEYLEFVLAGEKFNSTCGSVSYRKVRSVTVADESSFNSWAIETGNVDLVKVTIEPRKTEIKKAIESGKYVEYVEITEKQSMIIK